MKIRDYITLARLNIKENKRQARNSIILVVLSLTILLLSSLIYNSVYELKDRTISQNTAYRRISFHTDESMSSEQVLSTLSKIDDIVKVVQDSRCNTSCDVVAIDNTKIDGFITFWGANEDSSPSVIKGRNFKGDEEDVCIIPKDFYPYHTKEDATYQNLKKHFLNGEDLIGKEIEISCDTYLISDPTKEAVKTGTGTARFKVIGVYDTFSNIGNENECYVSYNNIKKISSCVTYSYGTDSTYTGWTVIPDRSANAEKVLLDVCKVFPYAMLGGRFHMEAINGICFAGVALAICFMIIAFINILTGSIKRIADKTGEIGMLKSMGYKNRQIHGIYEMETFINGIIAFIIMAVLSGVIIIAAKIIIMYTPIELSKIPIVVGYKFYIIAFFAGVIMPLIATWFAGLRITRIPAGIAIKEE